MSRLILAEPSALIALMDHSHPFHQSAVDFLETTKIRNYKLITTNHILVNVCDDIRRHYDFRTAAAISAALRNSRLIRIETLTPDDEDEAWRIFQSVSSTKWSFWRCSAAAVMNRLKISTLFTFEKLMSTHGYKLLPEVPR